jgi:hypothetical protein
MGDEINTVDDIVNAHAAKLKEEAGGENQEKDNKGGPPAAGADDKGAAGGTPDGGTPPKDPAAPVPNAIDDLLKELNLESLDALKEKLKPKDPDKPETPEEKEKRENLYKAGLIQYATEKGGMKPDDFSKLDNLKAKKDEELVYENWLEGWKEENPGVEPLEAERLAKEDFKTEYKLESTNEKAKARGLSKIEKEAKELRTPLESAYNSAKQNYDEEKAIKDSLPDFEKKVSGFVKEFIPEKFEVFKIEDKFKDKDGEKVESVPIEVELSAEDRVAIFQQVAQEIVRSGPTYNLYKKGDLKAIQALAKEKAEALIRSKYLGEATQKIATAFLSRGMNRGSGTGAKNPFPLVGDGKEQADKTSMNANEQVMNSLRGQK